MRRGTLRASFVLTLVLGFSPLSDLAADDGGIERIVRVVTFNIWHARKENDRRLDQVAEILAREQPDLVGLQEVSRSSLLKRQNRAQVLAARLGMSHTYHASDGIPKLWEEGLAVLAKGPIVRTARKKLTHSYFMPFEARQVLMAETRLEDGTKIALFNVHLGFKDGGDVENLEQALDALEVVAKEALARGIPAFLVGDFNARSHHFAMRALTGDLLGGGAPFIDTWAAKGSGPGLTLEPKNPNNDRDQAEERVDYILALRGTPIELRPKSVRLIGNEPDPTGLYPSDHYGIAAEFELFSEASPDAPDTLGITGALLGEAATPTNPSPSPSRHHEERATDLLVRIATLRKQIATLREQAQDEIREEARLRLGDRDGREPPVSASELRTRTLQKVTAAIGR